MDFIGGAGYTCSVGTQGNARDVLSNFQTMERPMNAAPHHSPVMQSPEVSPEVEGCFQGSEAIPGKGLEPSLLEEQRDFKTLAVDVVHQQNNAVQSRNTVRIESYSVAKTRLAADPPPDSSPDLLTRIRAKVVIDANGCWIWQASKNSQGYGQIAMRRGFKPNGHVKTVSKSVHRLVAALAMGRALRPDELACHTCDVRLCCNPEHIYTGSAADNMRDMHDRGRAANVQARRNAAKTHCPAGHEYTPENTMRGGGTKKPFRFCRTCRHAQQRAMRERRATAQVAA